MALFSDGLGWLFALAGIYMLRRSSFPSGARWMLGAVALGPKVLFRVIRAMNAPSGLSFPIEPNNLATSSSLWAWAGLAIGLGLYFLMEWRRQSRRPEFPPNDAVPAQPRLGVVLAVLGVACVIGGVVLLLGVFDGFQRIDDAGSGRWALHHAFKGRIADFSGSELTTIVARELPSRRDRPYEITIALADGRAFSLTTRAASALDELRKFAATANLAPGTLRIAPLRGGAWTNGSSGITLADCAGVYELADANLRPRSRLEFWIENERLMGKETLTDSERTRVRVLRKIKVNETGDAEFQPASYFEASQQKAENTTTISLSWSTQTETGKFIPGGFQTGVQKYRKQ